MIPASNLFNGHRVRRPAFSLLEVLLALAISVMLIAAVSWAIRMNLYNLQNQQDRIERSQVARGIVQMISHDLRAAIQYKPADVSGLEALMSSQSAAGLIGNMTEDQLGSLDNSGIDPAAIAGGAGGGGTGGGGIDPSMGGTAEPAVNPAEATESAVPPARPGLYGTATEIVIDISRLPRVDQYDSAVTGNDQAFALPSDVKTIGYFVSQQGSGIGRNSSTGGLYRRSLDRAIASFASNNGMNQSDSANQLVAPEVVQIQFRYFDGENWQNEWNSDEMGGFPTAVEFGMHIDPSRSTQNGGSLASSGYEEDELIFHRSVVHLPLAEIIQDDPSSNMAPPTNSGGSAGGR